MTPQELEDLMLRVPELLKYPDGDGVLPDFVVVGVDDRGDWQVCRWIGGDPFDENGPIGENRNLGEALKEAFKTVNPKSEGED